MSKLLINESPLLVLPSLAKKIGLNEAIILQQVHYLINPEFNSNKIDDRYWVYNTYSAWRSRFSFLSEKTIKRTFLNLEKLNMLIVRRANNTGKGLVKMYTVNYEELYKLEGQIGPSDLDLTASSAQNDRYHGPNWAVARPNLGRSSAQIGPPYLIQQSTQQSTQQRYRDEEFSKDDSSTHGEAFAKIGLKADLVEVDNLTSSLFNSEIEKIAPGGDILIEPKDECHNGEKKPKTGQKGPTDPNLKQKGSSKKVREVFDHWRDVMSHKNAKLDSTRINIIQKALKLGYDSRELCDAITGCSLTPFNMGENDRGERYDGIHVIFRGSEQIERFIRNSISPPRANSASEKLTRRNISACKNWINKKNKEADINERK